MIFDFISYSHSDTEMILKNFKYIRYILISSVWVPKLWQSNITNELKDFYLKKSESMLEITYKYLIGKFRAEWCTYQARQKNVETTILRLPIVFGKNEKKQVD